LYSVTVKGLPAMRDEARPQRAEEVGTSLMAVVFDFPVLHVPLAAWEVRVVQ